MGQREGLVIFGLNQYVALWILWDFLKKTIAISGNQTVRTRMHSAGSGQGNN